MLYVPPEIVLHILARLPTEPLIRFRLVCKEWRKMIDDPFFVKLQFDHHKTRGSDILVIRNKVGELHSMPLCFLNCSETLTINSTHKKKLNLPKTLTTSAVSCHDMILIWYPDIERVWKLWNPFTGECLELPRFSNPDWEDGVNAGLGYDAANDDYKVVRISLVRYPLGLKTLIYSLKSGTWCIIPYSRLSTDALPKLPSVFVNGALHWIANDNIIALDLQTECYCELPHPCESTSINHNYLDELGGYLCFSSGDWLQDVFIVWILECCGGESEWVKLFTLPYSAHSTMRDLRLVAYMESKRQVVMISENKLVLYNLEKGGLVKIVTIDDADDRFYCKPLPARLDWLLPSVSP